MITIFRQAIRRFTTTSGRRLQNASKDIASNQQSSNRNILFCGTDEFAKTCLEALVNRRHLYKSIQVLTPSDHKDDWGKRRGKHERVLTVSPVKEFAMKNDIRNYEVPSQSADKGGALQDWFENELPKEFKEANSNANFLLTCSFGFLIPPMMLNHFDPMKRLNVHPSLLPALRGAAPIQHAIAKRLKKTGVSIQTLGEKFDTGDILAQVEVDIPEKVTYSELYKTLQPIAADLLVDTMENFRQRSSTAWSQDDPKKGMKSSRAPALRPDMAEIKWNKWSAEMIEARHRAMNYIYPLTTSTISRKNVDTNLILREVDLYDVEKERGSNAVSNEALNLLRNATPGTAFLDKKSGLVLGRCAEEQSAQEQKEVYLRLITVQTVGKKPLAAEEWANGFTVETKGAVRKVHLSQRRIQL